MVRLWDALDYRDLNNDGVINDKDRTWIGDPFPDFAYGLNIDLSYKNFDLIMYFQGVNNVDVINSVKYTTDFGVYRIPVQIKVLAFLKLGIQLLILIQIFRHYLIAILIMNLVFLLILLKMVHT